MPEEISFPFQTSAIRISQPLGEFYVACLNSDLLIRLAYADPLRVTGEASEDTWTAPLA